ncbi:membrane protein US12E [Cercopithecine betaherpesvirus 5]|uniref:Membrane protein US12E n=1 Tax=Simian cytomegalovirus (strain Colburn) TaxID=50292 RepID=G8XU56_SCMVC|nr:membrane protein US12E [Cercopithecine betaherpesvirus 5]
MSSNDMTVTQAPDPLPLLWLRRKIIVLSVYAWTFVGIAVTVVFYGVVRMAEPTLPPHRCLPYPARQLVVLSPIVALLLESYGERYGPRDAPEVQGLGFMFYIAHLSFSNALIGVCMDPIEILCSCCTVVFVCIPASFVRWKPDRFQMSKAIVDVFAIGCLVTNIVLRNVMDRNEATVPMFVVYTLSLASFASAVSIILTDIERHVTQKQIKSQAIVFYCHLNLAYHSILIMWYAPWPLPN